MTEAQGAGEYVDLMVILKVGMGEIRKRKGKGNDINIARLKLRKWRPVGRVTKRSEGRERLGNS